VKEWTIAPDFLTFIHAGHAIGEGWGSWLDWGIVLSLALCATIVVLIGLARLLYPRHVVEGKALLVNLLALVILPLMVLPFANFTIFEYTKQVNFCGSCHTMQAYVDDMRRPGGRSLSALHYQIHFTPTQPGTECYSCHVTYGVHGTLVDKADGLDFAYSEYTGLYKLPIQMRQPFPNKLCLKCHVQSKFFLSQTIHLDKEGKVLPLLLNDTIACEMCHASGHLVGDAR
jgi:cytochrome c nitrite reductase small subunit